VSQPEPAPSPDHVIDADDAIERLRLAALGEDSGAVEPAESVPASVDQDETGPTLDAGAALDPADDPGPAPRTFHDLDSFLQVRDEIVESYLRRLNDHEDGLASRLLVEVYVTSIETRLALGELRGFVAWGKQNLGGTVGRILGRLGKGGADAEG
jgi:hypothetical protein